MQSVHDISSLMHDYVDNFFFFLIDKCTKLNVSFPTQRSLIKLHFIQNVGLNRLLDVFNSSFQPSVINSIVRNEMYYSVWITNPVKRCYTVRQISSTLLIFPAVDDWLYPLQQNLLLVSFNIHFTRRSSLSIVTKIFQSLKKILQCLPLSLMMSRRRVLSLPVARSYLRRSLYSLCVLLVSQGAAPLIHKADSGLPIISCSCGASRRASPPHQAPGKQTQGTHH